MTPIRFSLPLFVTFCIASAVWSSLMLLYSIHILRADFVLQRTRRIESKTRAPIVSMGLCQLMNIPTIILFIFQGPFENIPFKTHSSTYPWYDRAKKAHGILWPLVAGLLIFTMVSLAIPSIEAMQLAKGGIKTSRSSWITTLRIAFRFVYAIIAIISISIAASDSDLQLKILNPVYASIVSLLAIFYGSLSYKFSVFSKSEIIRMDNSQQQKRIRHRSLEIHHATLVYTVCLVIMVVFFGTQQNAMPRWSFDIMMYLWIMFIVPFAVLSFIFLRDIHVLTSRCLDALNEEKSIQALVIAQNTTLGPSDSCPEEVITLDAEKELIDIKNGDREIIGKASPAPRPLWLPDGGIGQAAVPPKCWSITIENWLRFTRACIATETWACIAKVKGENEITMYDINTHFIKPWTKGTGCSVAMLFDENPSEIELMISHAWGGSVKETLLSIESLVSLYYLPKDARMFFCTLCMYQPEDGAQGGLSIQEQLDLGSFAKIIELKPKYGMYVIHTTCYEVYKRLWCVHEVDEGVLAGIEIHGAFDSGSWTLEEFDSIIQDVQTSKSECQPQDKVMLTKQIETRGGFTRLDATIVNFRQQARKDLESALQFEQLFGTSITSV